MILPFYTKKYMYDIENNKSLLETTKSEVNLS